MAQPAEDRPAVDLVHFTILRPPEKQDGTPIRELALIAFPIARAVRAKLKEFDLIIFDRYAARPAPAGLFREHRRLCARAAARCWAGGPEFADASEPLPHAARRRAAGGADRATCWSAGFRPKVTEIGQRHPVTADLPQAGEPGNEPNGAAGSASVDVARRARQR